MSADPIPQPRNAPLKIINGRVEAWAEKESHDMLKKWQERYFVIDPKLKKIVYYEVFANNTVTKKGDYQLSAASTCKRVGSGVKPNKSNVVLVSGNNRGQTSDLFIAVASSHDADEWIRLLNKAIKGEVLNEVLEEVEDAFCVAASCAVCTIA